MAEDACTICLCRLGSESIAALPCRHVYHYTCILQWMYRSSPSKFCPICKKHTESDDIIGPLFIEYACINGTSDDYVPPSQERVLQSHVKYLLSVLFEAKTRIMELRRDRDTWKRSFRLLASLVNYKPVLLSSRQADAVAYDYEDEL